MIDFLHPWMLLGIFAALIPLVLHLFGRHKAPEVAFTALAFLMSDDPRRARALRLRERVLLIVRSLFMVLIALLLGKPLLPAWDKDGVAATGGGPVAAVFVLDDSMSMMARVPGGQTRLQGARERILRLIEGLPQGSTAAVVASGYPARALQPQLSSDLRSVAAALRRLVHYPRRDDAHRALALTAQLLASASLRERAVVVFTDMQARGWGDVVPPWERTQHIKSDRPAIHLRVERIEAPAPPNTALIAASVEPAPDRGPQQVRVEVEIAHSGPSSFRGYLTLRAAEREVKSWLVIPPGETARRSFVLPAVAATAEISLPADGLPADDRRFVRLSGGDVTRVALIDGAPRPVPREDEVFFAERALQIGAERAGAVVVDVLSPQRIDVETLGSYDAIVLANVGALTALQERELGELVDRGAGLLITAGDALPEDLSEWLPTLLPHRVEGLRVLDDASSSRLARSPEGVEVASTRDAAAPAAVQELRERFSRLVMPSLRGARLSRYLLVRPDADVGRHVVLRSTIGAPIFLLAPRGRGLVGLLTTTLDRDWANLPLQPGYLPLLQELVSVLAGREVNGRQSGIEPGDTAVLLRHPEAASLVVRRALDTGGAGSVLRRIEAVDAGSRSWKVDGLLEPGRYLAREQGEGDRGSERTIIVVPPASESDLRALPGVGLLRSASAAGSERGMGRSMVPAWSLALVLLLLLFLFEGVLLSRGAPKTARKGR